MPSQKSLKTKLRLAKKGKQTGHIPMFVRAKTDNSIRWNYKRRHWRRTKIKL